MKSRWTLTEADLKEVPDKELVQRIISSVLEFVGELGPGEDDYELVRQTPKSAQFFWAIRLLESEVNNGGFEQYSWNSARWPTLPSKPTKLLAPRNILNSFRGRWP